MANVTKYSTKSGVRYRVRYRKPDGSQTDKRGFKRKIDAENWAAEHVTTAKATGTYIDPQQSRITVGALATAWLAKKRISVKPSYMDDLEGAWRKWVEPEWGRVSVCDVTREDAQKWVSGIAAGGASPSVVLRAHGVLAGILDDAVADRRIHSNPVRGVELPRKTASRHTYLTAVQLYAVADRCTGSRRTLILLLGLVGLRWGEAIGLTVGDVDFARRRITVARSATQVNRHVVVGAPKTWELRSVVFPGVLAAALHERCDGRAADALVFPDDSTCDGYMRQPRSPMSGHRSWFARACMEAGVPRMRVHDLRHTAASLMVGAGANVKAVQRQLGHKSAAMTLDVYADLFDGDLDEVGDALNRLVLENVGKMWAKDTVGAA